MKKFIRIFLIVVGILVVAIVVTGLVAPKSYDVTRSILIKANRQTVWSQVRMWKNFNNWSPWMKKDTTTKVTIEGTDGQKGSVYAWTSKEMGSGSLTMTDSKGMDYAENELSFKSWGTKATTSYALKDSAGGTFISWRMWGKNSFFGSIFFLVFNGEKNLGKDYDEGLASLKAYCEAHPSAPMAAYKMGEISTKQFPETHFVEIRREANMDEYLKNASPWMGEMMGQIMGYIKENHLQPRGSMFSFYYKWDTVNRKTDFSVAMPVDKAGPEGKGGIKNVTLKAQEYAYCDFWGDYSGIGNAHYALNNWLDKNGKKRGSPVLEEYLTDPGKEKDPAKWQTRVWYPIEK